MANYRTLNVSGLESTHDARGLKTMFEEYGEIEDAQIVDGTGQITFTNASAAREAQMSMNGQEVDGNTLLITPRVGLKPKRHAPTGSPAN